MSGSDQLQALTDRAKQSETDIASAKTETQAQLQARVEKVRQSSKERTDAFKSAAGGARAKTSKRWDDVQQSWTGHVAQLRDHSDEAKAEHDVKKAEHRAERREDDALAAVDFAFAVFEEAEYAVLDALLAREEADALVASA
jgi:vacuolar-type H+-ATPase subunit I/STV1